MDAITEFIAVAKDQQKGLVYTHGPLYDILGCGDIYGQPE